MARTTSLTAVVAVVLGIVLVAAPADAREPTIHVVDDPHDVTVNAEPGGHLTSAELRSVELKWFKATPRTHDRVRFKVKIAQSSAPRDSRRTSQSKSNRWAVPLDAEGWLVRAVHHHHRPEPLGAVPRSTSGTPASGSGFGSTRPRTRCRSASPTGASVRARPAVHIATTTLWTDPETGYLLGGSKDAMHFPQSRAMTGPPGNPSRP